ncbi:hypothetical protein UFOVP760_1 [uncultured Caudovirales phage]|uniref:Uncharacterized protein n=1 Tax=uncultured Caudovirales phage TaxID=2100421 RepID=A0A6J7XED0_9CAUD|nr:hypothetical protein UFOVP760_1 [uncultured Caudovirales phage]
MKRIRVTIENGIDEDCNPLTREFDILNAKRVYSKESKLHIVPFDSDKEITIEFDREILYIEGIEI